MFFYLVLLFSGTKEGKIGIACNWDFESGRGGFEFGGLLMIARGAGVKDIAVKIGNAGTGEDGAAGCKRPFEDAGTGIERAEISRHAAAVKEVIGIGGVSGGTGAGTAIGDAIFPFNCAGSLVHRVYQTVRIGSEKEAVACYWTGEFAGYGCAGDLREFPFKATCGVDGVHVIIVRGNEYGGAVDGGAAVAAVEDG